MKSRARIARIVRLKERIRDAKRGELAVADREKREAEDALNVAEAVVVQMSDHYARPATEISANELSNRADMVVRARVTSDRRRATLNERDEVRQQRARNLADAGRELAKLDVLDKRLEKAATYEENKREQALLDECSLRIGRTGS